MKVYDQVDRSQSRGYTLARTKWIDSNQGDHPNPDYRNRLLAMEVNEYADPSRCTATPPLEVMRFMNHSAASNQSDGSRHCVLTVVVSRAYFNATSNRDAYMEFPQRHRRLGTRTELVSSGFACMGPEMLHLTNPRQ